MRGNVRAVPLAGSCVRGRPDARGSAAGWVYAL